MKTQEEFLTTFRTPVAPAGVLIGIDYGNRRIGLAVSDGEKKMAFPLKTIEKLAELDAVVSEWHPAAFVVGMPFEPDGGEGFMTHQVRLFAARIAEKYALPVYPWDERDTSCIAADELAKAGTYGKKHKRRLDAHAAAVILQRALDALSGA